MDIRQSKNYAAYLQSLGWIVKEHDGIFYFIKKILFFSILKVQRPTKIDLEFIKKLARKHRALYVLVEPNTEEEAKTLTKFGWKMASPSLPSKTIILDLSQSEDKLLKQMHPKTRYNIKIATKRGVEIIHSKDIKSFADFWQKNRPGALPQRKNIIGIFESFGNNADVVFAYNQGEVEAGVVLLTAQHTGYYMYAAASKKGKRLFAPTLCAWEAIRKAKQFGATKFDFEGIYDSRFPLPAWKGFSKFKQSFGGAETSFPLAYRSFCTHRIRKKGD